MKTFTLEISEDEDYKKNGNSRIGGYPDLPIEISYPQKENYSLEFLAQINFQEFTNNHSILPNEGILYFFIDLESQINFKVFYSKDIHKLEKSNLPKELIDDEDFRFKKGRKISFKQSEHQTSKGSEFSILKYSEFDADPAYLNLNGYSEINQEVIFESKEATFFHPTGENPFTNNVELVLNRDSHGKLIGNKNEILIQKELLRFDKERDLHFKRRKELLCLFSFPSLYKIGYEWGGRYKLEFFMMKNDIINCNFKDDKISNVVSI